MAINGTGNELDNVITGNSANNSLDGGAGDDRLAGGIGNHTLTGGAGYHTYLFGRGDGQDQVVNGLATNAGPSGELDFGANIVTSQIWFQQSGSDLVVTVLGTQDRATIVGWYAHPTTQLQRFVTAGGAVLDTQLDQLVQAMATYAVGNPGFAPTTATQAPSDPSPQSALAAARH